MSQSRGCPQAAASASHGHSESDGPGRAEGHPLGGLQCGVSGRPCASERGLSSAALSGASPGVAGALFFRLRESLGILPRRVLGDEATGTPGHTRVM